MHWESLLWQFRLTERQHNLSELFPLFPKLGNNFRYTAQLLWGNHYTIPTQFNQFRRMIVSQLFSEQASPDFSCSNLAYIQQLIFWWSSNYDMDQNRLSSTIPVKNRLQLPAIDHILKPPEYNVLNIPRQATLKQGFLKKQAKVHNHKSLTFHVNRPNECSLRPKVHYQN